MIVRVTRGAGMRGLMTYLAGAGKANEHTEPHLVAGDGAVMAWWSDSELDRLGAVAIGGHLDEPRAQTGTEVVGGHVWHASLALPARDGELADETWALITRGFVDRMGFSGAGGKAGCRWAAVRHGLSGGGNDHVHLVVSLVRDDGTKAATWNDFLRASEAVAALEAEYGLTVIESRGLGRGSAGVTGAEVNKSVRLGRDEPDRETVARRVRSAAVGSVDEAEFVRRARGDGLLVRPRFAAGTDSVVVGYSAALRPAGRGQRPVWFGGGRLDRDLTLPRLRERWADTPQSAAAAAAEWAAAARHRGPVAPGREVRDVDPRLVESARADVSGLRDWLSSVPVGDTETWAAAARDASGMFAALSRRVESTPGPLARTATQLARSGQQRTSVRGPAARRPESVRTSRVVAYAMQVNRGQRQTVVDALLLRQLTQLAITIQHARVQSGDRALAHALAVTVQRDLMVVHADELTGRAAAAAAAARTGPQQQPDQLERPERPEHPEHPEHPDQLERPEQLERAEQLEHPERAERPGPRGRDRGPRLAGGGDAGTVPLDPPVPAGISPEAAQAARQLAIRTSGVDAPVPASHGSPRAEPERGTGDRQTRPDRGLDR